MRVREQTLWVEILPVYWTTYEGSPMISGMTIGRTWKRNPWRKHATTGIIVKVRIEADVERIFPQPTANSTVTL